MRHLGDFLPGSTVYVWFTTNGANGGRLAPSSGFEDADFRIYKNGSIAERASMAGVTVTSAFDGMVGVHQVAIGLADNTDAGFYAPGAEYALVLYPDETVDAQSISGIVATFSIARLAPGMRLVGVAQGGAAGTITLPAGASATDDAYNGWTVEILYGTGSGQQRQVEDYVGATNVATMDSDWGLAPDATSVNAAYPPNPAALEGALSAAERNAVADALLDRDMAAGADTGSNVKRTLRQALRTLRNKFSVTGGTVTFTKEDDVTPSHTAALTGAPSVTAADPAGP